MYTNLPLNSIVRRPHLQSGYIQGQETLLAPSTEKWTRNYVTECSNHCTSLSTLRQKGLSCSKINFRAIYTNLPVNAIVRLPHLWSGDIQDLETFLAPSADNRTNNYDTESSNHHTFLSTLRAQGLSRSKMKWWAMYTNLPLNSIIRLPHLRSGDIQGQEPFLALSAENRTCDYDTKCSNYYTSVSSLRVKGLSRSNMKWWALYTNLPVNAIVRIPYLQSWDIQG